MSSKNFARYEFVCVLLDELRTPPSVGKVNPYLTALLADKLIRAGRRLHRMAEDACNGVPDPDSLEAATERARNRVAALLKPYGIRPIFSGDPRGAVLKLELPKSKRMNGWGGEGWCVPS